MTKKELDNQNIIRQLMVSSVSGPNAKRINTIICETNHSCRKISFWPKTGTKPNIPNRVGKLIKFYKMKKGKKLTLKSEKVASLSKADMSQIAGGGTGRSTNHNFTCGLCTNTTIDTGDIIAATTVITKTLGK